MKVDRYLWSLRMIEQEAAEGIGKGHIIHIQIIIKSLTSFQVL